MTLNGHTSIHPDQVYPITADDEDEDDDTSRVPSSADYSDMLDGKSVQVRYIGERIPIFYFVSILARFTEMKSANWKWNVYN
jgi:hypothetical protein